MIIFQHGNKISSPIALYYIRYIVMDIIFFTWNVNCSVFQ